VGRGGPFVRRTIGANSNKVSSRSSALRRPGAGVQRSGNLGPGCWTYMVAVTIGNEHLSSLVIALDVISPGAETQGICICWRVT
jgi:hypothetical protein